MTLESFGWTPAFAAAFQDYCQQALTAGRVIEEHKQIYQVWTPEGMLSAEVSGKLRFQAASRSDFPAVGDWVALAVRSNEGKATIHAVLPRFSRFLRKAAGPGADEQIVAANINTVFLVMALNHDFNLRRLERYLVMAWDSGSNPVVVLTKADLCDDVPARLAAVAGATPGVPVHVVSAVDGVGLEQLLPYLGFGQTVALLGSSGVGKSTLLNWLAGDALQAVHTVRSGDDHGRHTTTSRTLFMLPSGGLVMDTPGMRELQLWDTDDGLDGTFADIVELGEQCRFTDCTHQNEPGCAIQNAIASGELPQDRFLSYQKLQRELAFIARKEDRKAREAERDKWKKITMEQRQRGNRP